MSKRAAAMKQAADAVAERLGGIARDGIAWRRANPCVMAEFHRIRADQTGRLWHRMWRRFWRARCLAAGHDPKICDPKDG